MNKKNRIFFVYFIISILLWFLPFIVRILFIDTTNSSVIPELNQQHTAIDIASEIKDYLLNNDKLSAFCLVFFNNLKVCFINIFGGFLLGLGTISNLVINGFYTADVFATLYENGMSINKILMHTLPHSIELVGIWISGAIGLKIAKIIINMMRNNTIPTYQTIKLLTLSASIMTLIILIAAYIETYISAS